MVYYIDLEVYFCLNFFMDLLVLLAVHHWNHCTRERIFCLIASGVGALYSTFALFFLTNTVLQWILTYGVVGHLLVFISMGFHGIKKHITYFMQLCFGMFFSVGLIEVIGNFIYSIKDSAQIGCTNTSNPLFGTKYMMGIVALCYIVFRMVLYRIQYQAKLGKRIVNVTLCVSKKSVFLKALCDSGNLLVEPITKKAVCVVDVQTLKQFSKENLMPIFIPYNTIDKQNGFMKGFFADSITVGENTFYKVPIAVHSEKLSKNNDYEIILPPEIFEKRGEYDVFRKNRRKTKAKRKNSFSVGDSSAHGR